MIRSLYFSLLPHPLVLGLATFAALWLAQRFTRDGGRLERRLWLGCLGVSALIYVALAAAYYSSFTFLDHVEAQVAATGATLLRGGPIYHEMDGQLAYALGYGPVLYWLTELGYRVLGPSLLAAKATTLAAGAITAFSVALVLRRRGSAPLESLGTLVAAALVPFGAIVWLRADPLLLACAALGWVVAEFAPPRVAQLLIGTLMGIAACLKLHGPIYLLPPLLTLVRRDGWLWTAAALAFGAVVSLLPFAAWENFGRAYAATLQVNAGHGLSLRHWRMNLEFAAFLSAPLWLAFVARRERVRGLAPENLAALGLAFAFLVVATIASKPGAGHWHFLPLLPSVVLLAARLARETPTAALRSTAMTAWAVTALFLGWTRHDDWIVKLWRDPARAQIAEVNAVVDAHPGQSVVMGAGENAYGPGYAATFVRPVLVLRGQPYRFDPAAIMDLRKARYPDASCASAGLWGDGPRPLVLIPRGEEPFALNNFYGGPTFPAAFRADFARRFTRRSVGEHFEVWAPTP